MRPHDAIAAYPPQDESTRTDTLKRLVEAGLLSTRSEGTFHYYAADYPALQALTTYLWEGCCRGNRKAGCG